jgi:hypothetical protein
VDELMNTKKKQLFGLVVAGTIIIAGIIGLYILSETDNNINNNNNNNNNNDTDNTTDDKDICGWENDPYRLNYTEIVYNLTLIISFGNGTNLTFSNTTLTDSYTSAFDLLRYHAQIKYTCQKFGNRNSFYVREINGLSEDTQKYWRYWINGDYAPVGCNIYVCQDNDIITWKYS